MQKEPPSPDGGSDRHVPPTRHPSTYHHPHHPYYVTTAKHNTRAAQMNKGFPVSSSLIRDYERKLYRN